MSAVAWILVAGAAVPLYAYVGYPLLLLVVGRLRRRRPVPAATDHWPTVSIVVPAYNEERAIAATLDQLLSIDYPADRRQILVVSDASTDRTDEIVRGYADRGVQLLRQQERGGKTAAENASRSHLTGEIIINTDASVRIAPDALRPLLAAFRDPSVGVASGRDVSVARVADTANLGESGYVGYEMWIRRLETRVFSIVGASGCFYGIRSQLHMTLVPEALSRDFAAALIAREHGYRSVSVDEAVCFVPRTSKLKNEYRRKVRTMARGMETLFYKRHLLNPRHYPWFSWMLFSHKICRWLTPWTVAGATLAAIALGWPSALSLLLTGGVLLGGAAAVVGWYWPFDRPLPKAVSVPAYAITGNVAAIHAGFKAMRGELNPIWEPTRRQAVDAR